MTLVEKLEEYRLKNRISQQKLGKMLSVHFSTINRWFQGHQKPNKIQEYHIKELLKGKK